jgi:hypothetical protein
MVPRGCQIPLPLLCGRISLAAAVAMRLAYPSSCGCHLVAIPVRAIAVAGISGGCMGLEFARRWQPNSSLDCTGISAAQMVVHPKSAAAVGSEHRPQQAAACPGRIYHRAAFRVVVSLQQLNETIRGRPRTVAASHLRSRRASR